MILTERLNMLFIGGALLTASCLVVATIIEDSRGRSPNSISCFFSGGALAYCNTTITNGMALLERCLDSCSASTFYYDSQKTAALVSPIDGGEGSPYPDECFSSCLQAFFNQGFYVLVGAVNREEWIPTSIEY